MIDDETPLHVRPPTPPPKKGRAFSGKVWNFRLIAKGECQNQKLENLVKEILVRSELTVTNLLYKTIYETLF
jgi:hypothetical protein